MGSSESLVFGSARQLFCHAFREALVEPVHACLVTARKAAEGVGSRDTERLQLASVGRSNQYVALDMIVAGKESNIMAEKVDLTRTEVTVTSIVGSAASDWSEIKSCISRIR
jgi:hypothetical protein